MNDGGGGVKGEGKKEKKKVGRQLFSFFPLTMASESLWHPFFFFHG